MPNETKLSEIAARLGYPMVLKPRRGSSGIGVVVCNDDEELLFFMKRGRDLVAQQFVEGTEITIDVLGDGDGNVLSLVPRQRLKVRAGEVERAVTLDDGLFREQILCIAGHLQPFGAINIQCCLAGAGLYFMEINARFGGGYPLADEAGAAFPETLLDMLADRPCASRLGIYKRGLVMSRYETSVYMDIKELQDSSIRELTPLSGKIS
ncbi:MAG: ATP-grasp domain-containing protein [Elusimicrobia bacterium]|nr:ATP-grasp domain-containing protein [Elusimicrobiota bacterium]